jgi:hypothetical protein
MPRVKLTKQANDILYSLARHPEPTWPRVADETGHVTVTMSDDNIELLGALALDGESLSDTIVRLAIKLVTKIN